MKICARVLLLLLAPCYAESALIPDTILRPLAISHCVGKVSKYVSNKVEVKKLCACTWSKIDETKGEKSAIISYVLIHQESAHWHAIQVSQVNYCASRSNLSGELSKLEKTNHKVKKWTESNSTTPSQQ